jgi:hypothetical protein
MSLNLVKLCVGIDSPEQLQSFIKQRVAQRVSEGKERVTMHTTRMVPKRVDELLDGGSLYWVIKGKIQCRQALKDIEVFTDSEGIRRCHLILKPKLFKTDWQPRRAFQGWRYLKAEDVPADLGDGKKGLDALPTHIRLELAQLGLL